MRLKTFTNKTMNLAMAEIREELGDEAIIVSTFEDRKGVKITAALDDRHRKEKKKATPKPKLSNKTKTMDTFCRLLEYHHIPNNLSNIILEDVSGLDDKILNSGLEAVIDEITDFQNIDFKETSSKETPLMLVGPAGVGKSITAAKIAAECRIHNQKVEVITTDSLKAGGIEQINAFTTAMAIPLHIASNPDDLESILGEIAPETYVIIDTPGMNPMNSNEMSILTELVLITKYPPTLVLSAGWDTSVTQDMIEVYQMLGVNRIIHTRTDTVKRFGTLITAIWGNQLGLMNTSGGPTVGSRIVDADAEVITDILTEHMDLDDPDLLSEERLDANNPQEQFDDTMDAQHLPWLKRPMEAS